MTTGKVGRYTAVFFGSLLSIPGAFVGVSLLFHDVTQNHPKGLYYEANIVWWEIILVTGLAALASIVAVCWASRFPKRVTPSWLLVAGGAFLGVALGFFVSFVFLIATMVVFGVLIGAVELFKFVWNHWLAILLVVIGITAINQKKKETV
jgi:drug/metabolite transporter (DMT)-like permease